MVSLNIFPYFLHRWYIQNMVARQLIFIFLISTSAIAAPEYKWEKIEGCTLVESEWNDGDSFTVRIPSDTDKIFRLYFVDTPEDGKDTRFPKRIADQAGYFGMTAETVVKLGDRAAEFTAEKLSKKPFTVFTLWQDALGASKKQRFYAYIITDEGPLCELLVSSGLARIYGKRIQLPEGMDSRAYLQKLGGLEAKAKAGKLGGWDNER